MIDPPKHDRMRALVSRVFTPRAIGGLEPMIRDVIGGYFDDRRRSRRVRPGAGRVGPVPHRGHLTDVGRARRASASRSVTGSTRSSPARRARSTTARRPAASMVEMGTYFFGLARQKRAEPADDMLSRLTQVEVEDDDGNLTRLTDVEIAGFGTLIGGAGAETVTKLVGNAGVLFDTNPDQWQLVLDDHETVPGAVEEILRYHPPSQYQGRFSVQDARPPRRGDPGRLAGHPADRRGRPRRAPVRRSRPVRHPRDRRRCRSGSGTASTRVWAQRSPAWRAASPSRRWRRDTRRSRSTTTVSVASTWPTSPGTPTSRSVSVTDGPPPRPGARGQVCVRSRPTPESPKRAKERPGRLLASSRL